MKGQKFKLDLAGKELKVEIRNLAEQANSDVLIRLGDTLVLTTCVMSKYDREEVDFFPLTVNYEERYYAAGKIRGSRYVRRETRPSGEAICNSRLIDRAIRPRFPKNLKRGVQVIATVLSWDERNDPDILSLISASLALSISDIPWQGPIAVVRIGRINGQFILNPTYEEREKSEMELVLAGGKKDGDVLINMIEGNFEELEESSILGALEFSEKHLKKLVDFQREISKKIGKEKLLIETPPKDLELEKETKKFLGNKLEEALYPVRKSSISNGVYQKEKKDRMEEVNELKEELTYFIEGKYPGQEKTRYARNFFEEEINRLVHKNILKYEKRSDGRALDEMREIHCEVGLIPRSHGSGLFCRGQTKALSILTLGAPRDVQLLEGMEIVGKKRFMHHYNFPPYSVGEIRPLRGPARRDIGHGMLVERALLPLIPSFEEFPYTIRVVSEILSSNGSTSMASVSSSSLALMDAGIKIKRPAAGIAIGLMAEKESSSPKTQAQKNYKILTDIQGPEDHHGDMDFKIAGTKKGIIAIQMDVKIEGITKEIFKKALERGKKSRLRILEKMGRVLAKPRTELSPYAPRTLTLQINPEKIREVIGPGGKVINEIIEKCEVSIDVQPSGLIYVTSEKEEATKKAISWIKNITREIKVGETFQGKVKKILDFGAFIEILPGQEGLLHISQLAPRRIKRVEEVIKIGDIVSVEVISIDEQGRINLSLKAIKKVSPRFKKRY
ncbi:polyribonucleotide nucleotidyltransferase [Patescibacteria group bacterium]|nr:polyribonucleotide nucleotidyltransferase [Patescibacteria group bacterium]